MAVVLSKQNYIKETIYIFSKYGPLRINIYRGLGKNWFRINVDYLNEKLDITVKDKGSQKNIRPVALFAGTEKCRCWESTLNPDSQGWVLADAGFSEDADAAEAKVARPKGDKGPRLPSWKEDDAGVFALASSVLLPHSFA